MSVSIIFTFIGDDKPGLVSQLSDTVTAQGGNWLESRMSQLAGKFAGIARVQIAGDKAESLTHALQTLSGSNLIITIQTEEQAPQAGDYRSMHLNLVGHDRTGIVQGLTRALSSRAINVCEMNTNVTSAPMTGEPLFEATAEIQVPRSLDVHELEDALEAIANELAVDIQLDD